MPKTIDQHVHETFAYLTPPGQNTWTPNTDVYETPEFLVVKLELAGVARSGLQVTLHERVLTVSGYRHDPCRQRCCSFRQMEIDYGPFERRLLIPRNVDAQRAQARFDNGFLRIELPKAADFNPATVTVVIRESV
jgi:HSP20 family protein